MEAMSFARHRLPPVVIGHAVWLYLRFTLSYRDVEDLLAERGLEVSNETIRRWVLKFGPAIARNLRRGRPTPHGKWHLDEMVVSIAGRRMYVAGGRQRRRSARRHGSAEARQGRRGEAAQETAEAAGLRRPSLSLTNSDPTARRCRRSGSQGGTSRICAPTTGPKTRTSRCDDGSARCRALNRPLQLSVSSPSTPPSTTSSTSSDTSSAALRF